jgi:multiple antibiotic resistance protein
LPGAPLTLDQFVAAIVTLLVVIDPPGVGLIFLALTSGMPEVEKRAVAVKASAIALAVLVGAALFGGALLAILGIGLPAFRIAGGLLLFAIAFEMVFEKRQERKVSSVAGLDHRSAIAAFPLAIPLIAGPGAITAAVLLAGRTGGEVLGMALLLLTIAAVSAVTLATLLVSSHLERIVSVTTQTVFARLTGVLLAALAVQFVIDGIRESVVG